MVDIAYFFDAGRGNRVTSQPQKDSIMTEFRNVLCVKWAITLEFRCNKSAVVEKSSENYSPSKIQSPYTNKVYAKFRTFKYRIV